MKTLPEGWKIVNLSEILETIENGNRPKGGIKELKEGVFSLGGEHLTTSGGFNFKNIKLIPENFYKSLKRGKIKFGDVLVVKDGATTGKCAFVGTDFPYEEAAVNEHIFILRGKQDIIYQQFLFYHLFSPLGQKQIDSNFHGAAIGGINTKFVNNYSLILPPLPTQKKIAAILEKAERLKEWRKEADRLTDEFLKSTFLEMFGDPVNNSNGWEKNKLQNLAEIVSGVTKGRKLSGKSLISAPYLRVANVQDGYLDLNEIKTIEVLPTDIEKYALLEGDVLLTEGGDPDKLGRGAVWYNEIKNCIHQNHIFRVRVNKAYLIPEFLSMLIGSSYGKRYFLKSAKQTTGIASINSMQLKNFPVILPPLDLQNKFANIVLQVEHLQEQQGQSKQHINDLFNALMQKAFKGELVN